MLLAENKHGPRQGGGTGESGGAAVGTISSRACPGAKGAGRLYRGSPQVSLGGSNAHSGTWVWRPQASGPCGCSPHDCHAPKPSRLPAREGRLGSEGGMNRKWPSLVQLVMEPGPRELCECPSRLLSGPQSPTTGRLPSIMGACGMAPSIVFQVGAAADPLVLAFPVNLAAESWCGSYFLFLHCCQAARGTFCAQP